MQRTQGMRNTHRCHIGVPWEQQTSAGTISPSPSESEGNMGKDGWETTDPQGQHKGQNVISGVGGRREEQRK